MNRHFLNKLIGAAVPFDLSNAVQCGYYRVLVAAPSNNSVQVRRSLTRFSGLDLSINTRSLTDVITITSEFEFYTQALTSVPRICLAGKSEKRNYLS
jgi:hypothetical protein